MLRFGRLPQRHWRGRGGKGELLGSHAYPAGWGAGRVGGRAGLGGDGGRGGPGGPVGRNVSMARKEVHVCGVKNALRTE